MVSQVTLSSEIWVKENYGSLSLNLRKELILTFLKLSNSLSFFTPPYLVETKYPGKMETRLAGIAALGWNQVGKMTDCGSRRVNSPSLPVLLPPRVRLQRPGGVSVQWPSCGSSCGSVLDGKVWPSPKKQEAPILLVDLILPHLCS